MYERPVIGIKKERLALEMQGFSFNLEDHQMLYGLAEEACRILGLNVVGRIDHPWKPYGHTGGLILAESHYMWHSWPEEDNLSLDIFTCSKTVSLRGAPNVLISLYQPRFIGSLEDYPDRLRPTEYAS